MPKNKINDYTFYKIVNVNADVNLSYVGSTVNMKERSRCHKSVCNNPNSPKHNSKLYKTIREHGGWGEFKMIPIGTAEQLTLTESQIIEEKYRVELKAIMNTNKCNITDEELKEKRKVYLENNKEAIAARTKIYWENNKDRINAKITCECGCESTYSNIKRHCKSKKHIDLMNNKNNIDVIHNE